MASLIAIDWGTTNRRGYLLDRDGRMLARRDDALGLLNVRDGAFGPAFRVMTESWIETHGPLPALLSGMVGARKGWREAPYCALPARIDDLARSLTRVGEGLPVWIVPGLSARDERGVPDVIRGEEVQALAAVLGRPGRQVVVLPGTHSKWIELRDDTILSFRSYMTGDLFHAVKDHTVIGHLAMDGAMDGAGDERAFAEGVDQGLAAGADLTHALFGARTRVLSGELAGQAVGSYLSGLLIGAEIGGARSWLGPLDAPVRVMAGEALGARYRTALEIAGYACEAADPESLGRVYMELARAAGLTEGGA